MSVKISPPWVSYYHKLKALFGEDPDIRIEYSDADKYEIKLFVKGQDKADALTKLLPPVKNFGGVSVTTTVIPANEESDRISLFQAAFEGNPVFKNTIVVCSDGVTPVGYIVFAKKVLQYWDDNLGDPYGNISTLAQEIAKDVFEAGTRILFCTSIE